MKLEGGSGRIASLAAVAAAAAALAAPGTSLAAPGVPGAPSPAVTCDLFAAGSGADSNPGTQAQPLRTVAKLVATLQPGKTGCLRAGSYGSSSTSLRLTTPQITLSSYPGETATVVGIVRIEATATGATLENLVLDGRNSTMDLSPLIYASNVVVRNNEITNFNTAICVHLDQYPAAAVPTDVLIEGNRIHNCGALPANNFDHGIYLGKAERTVVRGNWIYDNANRGIQLYSQAHHTLVTGNVIDGNGSGVIFGGEQVNVSADNVVENNVISNSVLRDNVESWWGGPVGTNNVVRQNCVGGGAYDDGDGGILSGSSLGFTTTANVIAHPQFVNRAAKDFTIVAGTACAGVLPGGSPPDTTAPDTTIGSGPSGTISTDTASFGFSSSESGSSFACKLDAAAYAACTSPKTYSALAEGSHTFTVRATDAAGNTDATPASRSFVVDAVPDPPKHVTIKNGKGRPGRGKIVTPAGQSVALRGTAPGASSVTVLISRNGEWRAVDIDPVEGDSYATRIRVESSGTYRFKATASGLVDSEPLTVRVR
jgi:parallel beta-helix repeat protein